MPSGHQHPAITPSEQPPLRAPLAAPPSLPSTRTLFLIALGLGLAVLAVYSRSLAFQFILDDHRFTADPRIQESGHIWDYFANYVWAQFTGGPPSFYRPVFLLWVRINFVLAGLSSWGWHLLSIAKHIAVAVLLGMLAWKLLRDWLAAFAAAALFALHPAQAESVSWVTVPDPLMALGILAALLFYLRYVNSAAPPSQPRKKSRKKSAAAPERPLVWMLASTASYFAALLCKETSIIFPVVIFAFALSLAETPPGTRPTGEDFRIRLLRALRHTAPFICVTALYLLMRINAFAGTLGSATQHLPWKTVILSWPATLWFYFRAMLWPVKSFSFADPTLVETFSARGVLLPLIALAFFALLLLLILSWMWRKSHELAEPRSAGIRAALVAGTLLLILPLLPALNLNALNPGDFLHGRYTYLPLAGLMLLIATAWSLLENVRPALLCAAAALLIFFAALTLAQQMQWKDDATLFATAHQLAPHNAPVAQNLANTSVQAALQLDEDGQCSEAIPIFERVLHDYPDDWYAWAGLGDCYVQLKNLPKAEESLHRAADLSHNSQVFQQWQELRSEMGLPNSAPPK